MPKKRKYILENGIEVYAKNFRQLQKVFEGTIFFDAYKVGRKHSSNIDELLSKSIHFGKIRRKG